MVASPRVPLGAGGCGRVRRRLSPAGGRTRGLGHRARPWEESRMTTSSVSAAVLLVFLAAAIFLAMTVGLMLGPLLVALATAFHTSVAVTGQLTAATAITWGLTAFLAGPVSDTYGRRRLLLT